MKIYGDFDKAVEYATHRILETSYPIDTGKWQGMKTPQEMRETLNVSFSVVMSDCLDKIRKQIQPNLPWADEHFEERVGGKPINPGKSYLNWPYASKSKESMKEEKFNHNYMERIWPKYASEGHLEQLEDDQYILRGIRYKVGDFNDIIEHLKNDPYSRQAYLPIWFPEDTGVVHGGRVPCTLGYHFIRRGNHLHVVYFIRSCDIMRHFRDDMYLAVRKVMWLIGKLINEDKDNWIDVKPGIFTMHITSLHCFKSDYQLLIKYESDKKDK